MKFKNLDRDVLQVINPPFWDSCHYLNNKLRKGYEYIFEKYLNGKNYDKLLDYGCGAKPYEVIIKKYIKNYIGVDISNNQKADYLIEPGQKLPFADKYFDVILSSQVLEHVEESNQYLNECNRLLKNNGLLFLSTHGTWQFHTTIDVQRWTSYGLKKLISSYNFEIIDFVPILGQLALTSQLRLTYYNSVANYIGMIGRFIVTPISIIYQYKMKFEDLLTPRRVKERDSAIYIVAAKKIKDV